MSKSASYFVKIYDTSFTSPKFLGSSLLLGVEVSQVIGLWAMFKANMKIHHVNGEIERSELEAMLPVWCQTKLDPKDLIDAWIKYKLLIVDQDLLKVNEWHLYEGKDLAKSIKRAERNKKYYEKNKDKTSETDIKTSESELNPELRRLVDPPEEEEDIEEEVYEEVDIEVLVQDEVNNEEFFDRDKRSSINYKIAEVCGWDKPTESQWGRIHKAGKEIQDAGYDASDVETIAQNLGITYGAKAITPQGIANNVQLVNGPRTATPEDIAKLNKERLEEKQLRDWGNDA